MGHSAIYAKVPGLPDPRMGRTEPVPGECGGGGGIDLHTWDPPPTPELPPVDHSAPRYPCVDVVGVGLSMESVTGWEGGLPVDWGRPHSHPS